MSVFKKAIIPIAVILFLVFSNQTVVARSIGIDSFKPKENYKVSKTKEFVKTTSFVPKSDGPHRTLQTPPPKVQKNPPKNQILKKIKKYFRKLRNRKRKIYAYDGELVSTSNRRG